MESTLGPRHLSNVLSELIALRGFARQDGDEQLQEDWKQVAGDQFAKSTKVLGLRRGVLQIAVANAPLLSQLVSFHKQTLLARLQKDHPEYRIENVQFRLRGDMATTKE